MSRQLNFLWLITFIGGFYKTLIPFTTMTLFDTALPSRSVTSLLVLGFLAVFFTVLSYVSSSMTKKALNRLYEPLINNALSVTHNANRWFNNLRLGVNFLSSELIWTIIILAIVSVISPIVASILGFAVLITGIVTLFYSKEIGSLVTSVMPIVSMFVGGYLVIEETITVGSMLFISFVSARCVSAVHELISKASEIKWGLDEGVYGELEFVKAYPNDQLNSFSKLTSWYTVASIIILISCIGLLNLPLERNIPLKGESIQSGKALEVKAQQSERVIAVFTKQGDRIEAGQPLITFYSPAVDRKAVLIKRIEALDAELEVVSELYANGNNLLSLKLEDVRPKVEKGSLPKSVLLDTELQLYAERQKEQEALKRIRDDKHSISLEIQRLNEDIRNATIYAPSDSLIDDQLSIDAGSIVNTGDVMFTLVPDNEVVVEAFATINDREIVANTKNVILTESRLGARDTEKIKGEVFQVSALKDENTQQLQVLIRPEKDIKRGLLFDVFIPMGEDVIWRWILSNTVLSQGLFVR